MFCLGYIVLPFGGQTHEIIVLPVNFYIACFFQLAQDLIPSSYFVHFPIKQYRVHVSSVYQLFFRMCDQVVIHSLQYIIGLAARFGFIILWKFGTLTCITVLRLSIIVLVFLLIISLWKLRCKVIVKLWVLLIVAFFLYLWHLLLVRVGFLLSISQFFHLSSQIEFMLLILLLFLLECWKAGSLVMASDHFGDGSAKKFAESFHGLHLLIT